MHATFFCTICAIPIMIRFKPYFNLGVGKKKAPFLTDWVDGAFEELSCEMQSTFLSDWIISMENKAELRELGVGSSQNCFFNKLLFLLLFGVP